jgi:predicted metal-dependent hydrolase
VRVIIDGSVRMFPVLVVRHRQARRYRLRLTEVGALRVTVPQRASAAGGLRFAQSQAEWIATEWSRLTARLSWSAGTAIWYRGEPTPLSMDGVEVVWGDERVVVDAGATIRDAVQAHLRAIAAAELPGRCRALGEDARLIPSRVRVGDQRSRWGSCSSTGGIRLNWRLIQMPPEVADYVMLHELVHLEHPDHSRRFWRAVEVVCPGWRAADQWLRRHARELA